MNDEPDNPARSGDPTPDEDEIVSAVLDGEATAAERAHVADEPRLHARAEAFDRVRATLADVAPVDDAIRDAAIAGALADAGPGDAVSSTAINLERERRRRRFTAVAAVAAVLLVVIPLLTITLTGRGAEDQNAVGTAAGDASEEAQTDAAAPSSTTTPTLEEAGGGLSLPEQAGLVYVGDLGDVGPAEALPAEVRARLGDARVSRQFSAGPEPPPVSSTPSADNQLSFDRDGRLAACATEAAATDPSLGLVAASATATLEGRPVIVYVFRSTADAASEIAVVTEDDCTVVARFAL